MTSVLTGLSGEEFVARATSVEAASFGAATVAGPLLAAILAGTAGAAVAVARPGGAEARRDGDHRRAADASPRPARGAGRCGAAWKATARRRPPPLRRRRAARGDHRLRRDRDGRRGACSSSRSRSSPLDPLGRQDDFAGVLWAAFAIGSAVGAIALSGVAARWPSERVALGAVALAGAAMLPIAALAATPATLALLAVAGLLYGPGLAATFDLRRRLTPPAFLGPGLDHRGERQGRRVRPRGGALGRPRRGDRRRRHDPRRRGDASGGERDRRPPDRLRDR